MMETWRDEVVKEEIEVGFAVERTRVGAMETKAIVRIGKLVDGWVERLE